MTFLLLQVSAPIGAKNGGSEPGIGTIKVYFSNKQLPKTSQMSISQSERKTELSSYSSNNEEENESSEIPDPIVLEVWQNGSWTYSPFRGS